MKNNEAKIKVIKLYGEVIENETLKDLKKQVGKDDFDVIALEIASPGGSVSEGLAIMVWLDGLSRMGKKVITIVSANAYSIASLIMLVADEKLISQHGEVMVHNPMIPELTYMNADQLAKYVDELRDLESMMYQLYETFTGLDKARIKELMDNETFLSPQEAVENGFADIIVDIKKKSYENSTASNQKSINMSKTMNVLNRIIGVMNKADFINQLYYSIAGAEVEISQKDPSTYSVGDKVNTKDGELKLSDGATLSIINSAIESIDRTTDAPENAEFNEGAAPEKVEVKSDPKAVVPVEAVEVVEVVEAVEAVDPPEKEEEEPVVIPEAVEPPAPEEPMIEPSEEPIETPEEEEKPDFGKMILALTVSIQALTDKMSAIESAQSEFGLRLSSLGEFEQTATDAIESIAKNTTSSFTAKAVGEDTPVTGSIFQRMKKERGL